MLSVSRLSCVPSDGTPVYEVSFDVPPGRTVVLLGPNGAGKSSVCRCLGALAPITGGIVTLDGAPLPPDPWARAKLGLLVVTRAGASVFPELSVDEHLALVVAGRSRRDRRHAAESVLDRFAVLRALRNSPAGALSGGEQQLLVIALAWATRERTRALVIEEPSFGLAPRTARDVYDALTRLAHDGCAVLTTEESPDVVRNYADMAVLLHRGRVHRVGPPAEILQPQVLDEVFLGVTVGPHERDARPRRS